MATRRPARKTPQGAAIELFVSHVSSEAKIAACLREMLDADFIGMVELFASSDVPSIQVGEKWLDAIREGLDRAAAVWRGAAKHHAVDPPHRDGDVAVLLVSWIDAIVSLSSFASNSSATETRSYRFMDLATRRFHEMVVERWQARPKATPARRTDQARSRRRSDRGAARPQALGRSAAASAASNLVPKDPAAPSLE